MQKHHLFRCNLIALFAFTLAATLSSAAFAGKISKPTCDGGKPKTLLKTANGVGAYIHPSAMNTLQCILKSFESSGLRIVAVFGYACRPKPTSNHPRGLAIDINQYARDLTKPTVPRQRGVDIAQKCHGTSGAVWRDPDNGHFELRSASRSQQYSRRPRQAYQPYYPGFFSFF